MKKTPNADLGRPTAEQFAAAPKLPVAVVLDNVRSLNNVGSFFRTCDAFAVGRLVLCGITGTPPDQQIHKTALGAELSVAWSHYPSTLEAAEALRAEGYTLAAVEQVEGAAILGEIEWEAGKRYALIFGNEVSGVAQEVVDICDMAVEIPQAGTKHSLNVAVSGGAVLWDIFSEFVHDLRSRK